MDSPTNLRVLKTILELSPDRSLGYPIEAVHEKLPEFTEEIIEGSINDLDKQRCFKVLRGDSTIIHLMVLPEALGYLRESEELKTKTSTQPAMQSFHVKNNYGAVGINTGTNINNTFNLGDLDRLISENTEAGSPDREELNELRQTLQSITENEIPISKGYLSRFSAAIQKHAWIAGPVASILLRFLTEIP